MSNTWDEGYHDYSADELKVQCWCGRHIRELTKREVLEGGCWECSPMCYTKYKRHGVGELAGANHPLARSDWTNSTEV